MIATVAEAMFLNIRANGNTDENIVAGSKSEAKICLLLFCTSTEPPKGGKAKF